MKQARTENPQILGTTAQDFLPRTKPGIVHPWLAIWTRFSYRAVSVQSPCNKELKDLV